MNAQLEFFKGNGFVAEVVRTNRRKTASVKVEEGKVSIVIPLDLPDSNIEQLVKNKTRWIREKIYLHSQATPFKSKEYVSGESFSYMGKNYRLRLLSGKTKPVKMKQGRLVVSIPKGEGRTDKVRAALEQWYRVRAEEKLNEKVKRYSKLIGVNPKSVSIKSFKSRWGSCHKSGDIQFNWLIIIAPNKVVDYVVVHELCHLKEHNHSPKFWKSIEKVLPDYLDCKEWLKDKGISLNL